MTDLYYIEPVASANSLTDQPSDVSSTPQSTGETVNPSGQPTTTDTQKLSARIESLEKYVDDLQANSARKGSDTNFNNLDVKDRLTANFGKIGGWDVGAGVISTPRMQIDSNNELIKSTNYQEGVSGFKVSPDLIEATNIKARGSLQGVTFAYDKINAIGGQLMVSNADTLESDMSALDSSTVIVKGDTTFAIDDFLVMRSTATTGIQEEWMRITEVPNTISLVDSYSESNANTSGGASSYYNTKIGQTFTGIDGILTKETFYLSKVGTITGTMVAALYAHTGTFGTSGTGTGVALATSQPINVSVLTGSNQLIDFTFIDGYTLVAGTKYVAVLEYSGGDGSNYIQIGVDTTSPSHSGNYAYYNGSWSSNNSFDISFYVYVTNALLDNQYEVTRDLAGLYASNSNPAWKAGTPVVKQGKADGTGGWLRLIGEGANAPYYSVFKRTGTTYNDYQEVCRLGNLNGYLGYATDEYGVAIGDSSAYLKYDPTNGLRMAGSVESVSFLTAGIALTAGQTVAMYTDGKVYSTDSLVSTMTSTFIGFCAATTAKDALAPIVITGSSSYQSSLTIASNYYLNDATHTSFATGASGTSLYSLTGSENSSGWQSFTTGASDTNIVAFAIKCQGDPSTMGINLREGEGISGTLLHYMTGAVDNVENVKIFYFPKPITVSPNTVYTISFWEVSGSIISRYATTSTYAGGRAGLSATNDFYFNTYTSTNRGIIGTSAGTNSKKVGMALSATKLLILNS